MFLPEPSIALALLTAAAPAPALAAGPALPTLPLPSQEAEEQEVDGGTGGDDAAPEGLDDLDEQGYDRTPFHGHLPIGFNGVGICLGNSRRWDGMRINFRDHGAELVRGVNLTFWSPREPSIERFEGLNLGIAPGAVESRGVALGLAASVTEGTARGIHLGGLASVSGEGARGIQIGGLAAVAGGGMRGVNAGGLAAVAEGGLRGLNLGGLAVVAEGGIRGANLGGLAVVSEGGIRGLSVGGLAVVTEGEQRGVAVAGLANVAESEIRGIAISGLATVAGDQLRGVGLSGLSTVCTGDLRGIALAGLTVGRGDFRMRDLWADGVPDRRHETSAHGLMLAGYRVQANEIEGLAGALLVTRSHDMTGFAFGAYNGVSGTQTGASLGVFNYANELEGIQIGLLNYVGNNPAWARWLPLVNAHF